MIPVRSSTIKAVGYDPGTRVLTVAFHSGGTYEYHGVTPDAHAALLQSPSMGKHLHAHIKPNHRCTPVKGAPQ